MPFFTECGLDCPKSYNPCDFLVEIANGEYGEQNDELSKKILNGQNQNYRGEIVPKQNMERFQLLEDRNHKFPNFFIQLWFLIIRYGILTYRDKLNMFLRLAVHVVCGILVALFFEGVGSDGSKTISNFKMVHGTGV